jgi:hypothetical protein
MNTQNIARFKTTSGSEYEIDCDEGVWRRHHNPDSTRVRTTDGILLGVRPWPIRVGECVVLLGPPLESGDYREIWTTRVAKILHNDCAGDAAEWSA